MQTLRYRINPGLRGALFYAAYWGAVGIYEPFLVLYFVRSGLDGTQIGWLAAVLPLCTLAIVPVISRIADHTRKRVVFLALACLGFGAALTLPAWPGFQPSFLALMGFVALFALFRSPVVSLADSLIAPMSARYALDFGSMRLWGSLVFTITATLLGLVWQRSGFDSMFITAGLAFLPVILAALLLEEPRRAPPEAVAAMPVSEAKTTRGLDPGLFFLLGSTFLIIAALFMVGTFGAVYMNELGGSEVLVGSMMGIAAMGEVPGMLFGSRVARRLGAPNTLLLSYGLIAAGHAATAFTHSPEMLLVYAAMRGLGFGLLLVCTVMTINNRAPHHLASTFQGILNAACWGLAPLLGGPISGWIYQNLGPATLFLTAAGMSTLAGVLILPTYRIWRQRGPARL